MILAFWRRWRPVLFVVLVMVGELTLFLASQAAVGRDRPPVGQLDDVPTGSYPSGHIAATLCLWGAIAILVLPRTDRWWRWVTVVLAVVMPLVVAASRVYRGMHHPTDIAGALLLTGLWVGLLYLIVRPNADVHAGNRPTDPADVDVVPDLLSSRDEGRDLQHQDRGVRRERLHAPRRGAAGRGGHRAGRVGAAGAARLRSAAGGGPDRGRPGHAGVPRPIGFGQPVGVFVRAGLPVLTSGPVRRPFHHAACRVEVGTDLGPLTVVSAHLNPHWPGRRRREAGRVAAAVRGRALALVCGDLNGLDPWTDHTDRVRRLAPPHRVRHLRWNGSVDTRAVAALDRAGLVDLYPGSGRAETVPTALGGAEFSGMRLDYLFGTPAVAARLRSYRVVEGGEVDKASDHYPVLAELDL